MVLALVDRYEVEIRDRRRVEDGLDPMNVMRDARANQKIPTNAWNTILSPAEASLHHKV